MNVLVASTRAKKIGTCLPMNCHLRKRKPFISVRGVHLLSAPTTGMAPVAIASEGPVKDPHSLRLAPSPSPDVQEAVCPQKESFPKAVIAVWALEAQNLQSALKPPKQPWREAGLPCLDKAPPCALVSTRADTGTGVTWPPQPKLCPAAGMGEARKMVRHFLQSHRRTTSQSPKIVISKTITL